MEKNKVYKILTILLVMQWAFLQILAQFPEFIEKYYSNGLYQYISKFLRLVLGRIPFSVGDLLYALIVLFVLKQLFSTIKNRRFSFKNTLFKTGGIISVLFFFFHLNWGLNYLRQPLYTTLDIEKKAYSIEELVLFTEDLIDRVNKAQYTVTQNDTLIVENKSDKNTIKENSHKAYEQLQKSFPEFSYEKKAIKHSLFSTPLTYMGFTGYLNPISNEAQVNSLMPKNNYPATLCHEIAHQVGIASESEANFVGYLAATHATDPYFNYSGYLMALRYCLFEIYYKDPEAFEALKNKINIGVKKDMQRSQDFWKYYQNRAEKYFKIFYDLFLKANKQEDGIKGYSHIVSLLINYHKHHDFK